MRFFFIFISFLILESNLFAQSKLPETQKCIDFISPVDYALDLSANFGELRYNHFHSGLDIRTKQTEGLPVRAIEDGYVTHINVWGHGYGKVIFVVHKNGIVSVYAHLQRFNTAITEWLHNYQYQAKVNEVSVDVPADALPIKKGEIIALSGNSGSSRGPHLHFELRDQSMKYVYNPLIYYADSLKDNIPPKFFYLAVYPLDDNSLVNGTRGRKLIRIIYSSVLKKYVLQQALSVSGKIGFAIQANDFFPRNYHDFGIYSLALQCDSQTVYSNTFDVHSLDDKRYINSYIDYEHFVRTGKYFQKMYIEQGNKMDTRTKTINNGVISCLKDTTYKITVTAGDYHNNSAQLTFNLRVKTQTPAPIVDSTSVLLLCEKDNQIQSYDMRLNIEAGKLYNDMRFSYGKDSVSKHRYLLSDVYKIGSTVVPLHSGVSFSIPLRNKEIYQTHSKKIYLAQVSPKGFPVGYLPIKYDEGWATGYPDKFGAYAIAIDTIKPSIRARALRDGISLAKAAGFSLQIFDYQSGIASYDGYIDDEWTVMESDKKRALITCIFDDKRVERGKKHVFLLVVKDMCGNEASYTFTFYR